MKFDAIVACPTIECHPSGRLQDVLTLTTTLTARPMRAPVIAHQNHLDLVHQVALLDSFHGTEHGIYLFTRHAAIWLFAS
jgi:hypothetical protein